MIAADALRAGVLTIGHHPLEIEHHKSSINNSVPTRSTVILGTGSYAPERILTNDDLSKMVDTSDEWIRTRTGIRERRVATVEETTSDMAVPAAKRALENAGLTPADIDLLVV